MPKLFISSVVPEKSKYYTSAFTRSGQNVMLGIADELYKYGDVELVSCQPVQSFPNGPLFIKASSDKTGQGQIVHFLPTINLLFLKNIVWGIFAVFYIYRWARKHKDKKKSILVYNIYLPIISLVYFGAKLSKCSLYAILYDLGVPPKHLNLGKLRMFGYRQYEKLAYKYIPKLNGRIIINEKIHEEYAPYNDYILIDGGVNAELIKRLFPLRPSRTSKMTYVLAGMLWEQNGTDLVLDALKLRPDLNVKVIFAGSGTAVSKILHASILDDRIEYVGHLNIDDLFKVYEGADVLLNLRLEEENDMHFPSKLFEYMSLGKWVVSTPIAHSERDYSAYLDFLYEYTPEALAAKMDSIALFSKDKLYKHGIKSREFILENRTWKKRTQEIVEYINR